MSEDTSKIKSVQELYDPRKENAVLACLLASPDLAFDADLTTSDFNNSKTRDIYDVLEHIRNEHEAGKKDLDFSPLNVDSVAKKLGITMDMENIRQLRASVSADGYFDLTSFRQYVQDLKEAGVRIKLHNAAEEALTLAHNSGKDLQHVLAEAENAILSVEATLTNSDEPLQIEMGGDEELDVALNRNKTGIEVGIRTGFPTFDERTGGLRENSMTVFGARAKTGKSLIGLNIASNVFDQYGDEVPILYLDTEMSTKEVRYRLWSIRSGINFKKIESGQLTVAEKALLDKTREATRKMPLFHLYMPEFTPQTIIRLCRKMQNKYGIRLVIFDYIKMPDDTGLSKNIAEWQQLGYLATALKNKVAGKLNLAVVTFAQLNRDGVQQAKEGRADEGSVGGSDRIIHYCTTFCSFQKVPPELMRLKEGDKGWKPHLKYGFIGNRMLHILNTRHGGDDGDPIPMNLDRDSLAIKEAQMVVPNGSSQPLSETSDSSESESAHQGAIAEEAY